MAILQRSLALIALVAVALGVRAEPPPSFVLIITDDAGYDDYGITGRGVIPTPNIDAIGRDGVVFTSGYVTASVCSPSRAGLLTGRYQQRVGHEFNLGADHERRGLGLPTDAVTIAEALKARGYRTGLIGKWHLGTAPGLQPLDQGFDEFHGTLKGSRSYFEVSQDRPDVMRDGRDPIDEPQAMYVTRWIGDQAEAFIADADGRPYFLVVSYTAPHTPMHALDEDRADVDPLVAGASDRRKTYAAMVAALDRSIGDVLDAIQTNGMEDKTVVALVNDNGGATNNGSDNGPLRGMKGSKWEGGVRVPMAMRWPGLVPAGLRFNQAVLSIDLTATFIAAAGAPTPPSAPLDGVDLRPFLTGERVEPPHDAIFWRRGVAAAVRSGDWKLIRSDGNPNLLFNLAADAGERIDLSAQRPEVIAGLLERLRRWEASLAEPRWTEGEKWERNQRRKHRIEVQTRQDERKFP